MTYSKTIFCFADSRKLNGRCIAGKEWSDTGVGDWIRPVGPGQTEEVSLDDRRYENGNVPRVLDIIRIPMKEPKPHGFQQENHLIDDGYYWTKLGAGSWDQVVSAIDRTTGPLWIDGDSTYNGHNDRINLSAAAFLTSSLMLIRPTNLVLTVGMEGLRKGGSGRSVLISGSALQDTALA